MVENLLPRKLFLVLGLKLIGFHLTLVDKQMIINRQRLHDKHIQFGECMIHHQFLVLEVFVLSYWHRDTMNFQETAFKQYFANLSTLGDGILCM